MTRISSLSERPGHHGPRRLVHWLNPAGERKVHSLVDKMYKRKNLEVAWEKVKRNRGAGGVDGEDLAAFEASLDANLEPFAPGVAGRGVCAAASSPTPNPEGGPAGEVSSTGHPDDL